MRRALKVGFAIVVTLAALWIATPSSIGGYATVAAPGDDLDGWIAERERLVDAAYRLVPGTEARIRWQSPGERSEYAVVHLHGFSASRQETAPLAERLADRLEANLFEARLDGHGQLSWPMADVSAEDWLQDAATAFAIGEAIGDKLVVITTSTGGTLALAMIGHPRMQSVDTLVLIAPNMMPADPAAQWLTRPGGPLIARLLVGETRSWLAHNAKQATYWTTTYPTEAIVEVMRLVDFANGKLPAAIDQNLLVFQSPDDIIVSPAAARAAYDAIDAPRKRWVDVSEAGDPSNHVLAGDILSPGNTQPFIDEIVSFVRSEAR
ncbi:MAG: alpha/beta fold hydrolase [Woeseiaceae bacterium]|nr:alpha/beta fold hydrolase [Woeseiaceae bacterium]